MKYCRRCVMSDKRPFMQFDEEGVCYPCRAAEQSKKTDWSLRWRELEVLADVYRGWNGDGYDCIIAASGGKDSWYQTYIMKEKLGMNPLLVSVDNYSWTETGKQNWANLKETFGVDAIVVQPNQNVQRGIDRQSFLKYGWTNWLFDKAIYAVPAQMSVKLGIPLLVYGEDTNYMYGGPHSKETPDAKKQFTNDVAKPVSDDWGYPKSDLNTIVEPDLRWTHPIFLSYYVPWSAYEHVKWARSRGFKTLDDTGEWKREGYLTQYEQIDSVGYLTKKWLMFPKFGHQRVTESASIEVREGRMTREQAVDAVINEDWKWDHRMITDFIRYIGITADVFWDAVDGFANTDIVEKRGGDWRLKKEIENILKE
jgi:N-acetyl sugar amidotransferase